MNTKKCSKCGWEYPRNTTLLRCLICHTRFEERTCARCGKPTPIYQQGHYCRECFNSIRLAKYYRNARKLDGIMQDWIDNIKKIKAPHKLLTEEQWMHAVQHFGKCALCGDESIDARMLFIPFRLGGKYCEWNVIPVCEKCSTKRRPPRIFGKEYLTPEMHRIIDFLEPIIRRYLSG